MRVLAEVLHKFSLSRRYRESAQSGTAQHEGGRILQHHCGFRGGRGGEGGRGGL
jgi:hypothetical protein